MAVRERPSLEPAMTMFIFGGRSDSKLQNQNLSSPKGSLLMIKHRWAVVFSLSLFKIFLLNKEKSRKFSLWRAKLNQSTFL